MTRNILLIFLLSLSYSKSQSQNSALSFFNLHTLILQTSIDDAQKLLKERGFIFNGSKESKDTTDPKRRIYIRCTFIKKPISENNIADEIVLWRQKDSTSSMFEMLEFNSYDEAIYTKLKSECETSKFTKKLSEKVEKNCISVDYSEEGFIETFQNCTGKNDMVYKVTFLNLLVYSSD